MSNETQNKFYHIYCITNKINRKIYIGQTVQPNKRWWQHRYDAANPTQIIHHAINKYGADNFEFKVIATCKTQDDANSIEEELIKQYDCLVNGGRGYNIALGGMVAPKSEEWKLAMEEWRNSLTSEERAEISQKQRQATLKQISEKGHPAQGTKRTDDQRAKLSLIQQSKDNDTIYTEEVRQRMSDAHKGKVIPDEQRKKMSEGIKKQWVIRGNYESKKCIVPGCEVSGKASYRIIDGNYYCMKHGLRMIRHDNTDKLAMHIQSNQSLEERKKCGAANIGKVPHNRIIFTAEQIKDILNNNLSIKKTAKLYNVTEKVIKRVREGKF